MNEFNRAWNGGRKRQFLQAHKDKILWLIDTIGVQEACKVLNVRKAETLESLVYAGGSNPRQLTTSEKADMRSRVAIAGLDELRLEIKKGKRPALSLERFDGWLLRVDDDV